MPRGTKEPDIRDVPVSDVIMELDLRFCGGTLAADPIGEVWRDVLMAFDESAKKHGLRCSWQGALSCHQPKQFERMVEKRGLELTDAPDAQV